MERMKSFWTIKKVAGSVFGVVLIVLFVIIMVSSNHKGDPFIKAIANERFYVEGHIGSIGSQEEAYFRQFKEYKTETEHGIVNLDRAYYAVGDQYFYGEGDGSNRSLIPDEHNPGDIFSRESVFSNRDLSKVEFCCEGSEAILDIETMETKFRHYEEYRFIDTNDCIRLYFSGEQIYAIRAREDARSILYVSSFSTQPPG